jgi:hypothetical protein
MLRSHGGRRDVAYMSLDACAMLAVVSLLREVSLGFLIDAVLE